MKDLFRPESSPAYPPEPRCIVYVDVTVQIAHRPEGLWLVYVACESDSFYENTPTVLYLLYALPCLWV